MADVAGYSHLMGVDEVGTARTLREHRAVSDTLVAENAGRMITAFGDPETKRKAIKDGATGLLTKPIDFTLLRLEIDSGLQPGPAS